MHQAGGQGSAKWRKSSATQNVDCVEFRFDDDRVLVRDSKNSAGPTLSVGHSGWFAFVASVRN